MKRALQGGIGLASLTAWIALSSVIFVFLTGWSRDSLRSVVTAWPVWLWYANDERYVRPEWQIGADLRLSAILAGIIVFSVVGLSLYWISQRALRRPLQPAYWPLARTRQPVRSKSLLHGDARWLDMKEAKRLFPGPHGIPVGEAYVPALGRNAKFDLRDRRTWGQAGKAPLLIDPCTSDGTHGMVIAGSGGGKTLANIIPALMTWQGSAVVFDPARQIGPMTETAREIMGQTVRNVRVGGDGFDALGWIDLSDPMADLHAETVVTWIAGDPPADSGKEDANSDFRKAARVLQTCLLADLLMSDLPRSRKTLKEWRRRLLTPENRIQGLLDNIATSSNSAFARDCADQLRRTTERTFSGAYFGATTNTAWLSNESLADLVSSRAFEPRDILDGNTTVYVQLAEDVTRTKPGVARTIIGALAKARWMDGGQSCTKTLFAVDETRFLGRLQILADILEGGRKHGCTLLTAWQSRANIEDIWGKSGLEMWESSTSWQIYAAIGSPATAEYVSKRCGCYTALVRTQGTSNNTPWGFGQGGWSRGQTDNVAEQEQRLIRPEGVMGLPKNAQIVFRRGVADPMLCGRPYCFMRSEWALAQNPYEEAVE